jgi:hypothetical protein
MRRQLPTIKGLPYFCTIINENDYIFTTINEISFHCILHIVPVRSIPKNYRSLTGKVNDARRSRAAALSQHWSATFI